MTLTTNKTYLTKDFDQKKIFVTREFNAARDQVWDCWTKAELLDQWWAPKPWKAVTKSMDFKEGGKWLYYMAGPEGEKMWASFDYQTIDPKGSFTALDTFCDEEGNKTPQFNSTQWKIMFQSVSGGTKVEVEMTFDSVEDLNKMLEMGFEEGFTMGHGNLDELLETIVEL